MSGKINFINYVVLSICGFAIVTDLIWGKIFNWFTLPTAIAGLIVSTYLLGWHGGFQALLGIIAGLLFYGWMFGIGIIGGGDVKLLMALGAWGGFHYIEEVAILGVILGGVFSFGILVFSGKLFNFLAIWNSILI